ncbi:MAG TPA: 1,4-alpha-glucan branching enzyme, partial [Chromatiaceae bacterium]|nr:1,4-alpha-glucan branching enzyme [Chromatiaceae bacterium]
MTQLEKLQQGRHHDPFDYLGRHPHNGGWVIRAFMPNAEQVQLESIGPMNRVEDSDLFVIKLSEEQHAELPRHYRLRWQEKHDGSWHSTVSPYSFDPQIGDLDL